LGKFKFFSKKPPKLDFRREIRDLGTKKMAGGVFGPSGRLPVNRIPPDAKGSPAALPIVYNSIIYYRKAIINRIRIWIPAFAGMTT
jgi:hypothetical protein